MPRLFVAGHYFHVTGYKPSTGKFKVPRMGLRWRNRARAFQHYYFATNGVSNTLIIVANLIGAVVILHGNPAWALPNIIAAVAVAWRWGYRVNQHLVGHQLPFIIEGVHAGMDHEDRQN